MRTLLSLFRRSSGNSQTVSVLENCPGLYEVNAVGESNYQESLRKICGGYDVDSQWIEVDAELCLEDNNPHDPLAVRVEIKGKKVGYLDRHMARRFRDQHCPAPHSPIRFSCPAAIVGGWDRGYGDRGKFGVKLDVPME